MNRVLALLALSLPVACSQEPARAPRSEPSFTEGMRRLCEVDQRAVLDAELDPITIESERYDWALAHVEHPDVIELLTLMRVRSDAERVEMLDTAAVDAGLSACPLADTLRQAS